MDADEITDVSSPEPEPAGESPTGASDPGAIQTDEVNSEARARGLARRRFLTAAALGTAAAVAVGKGSDGLRFGPSIALANDLSNLPCTAQDVEVIGQGVVANEACVCTGGTFNATVQFTVRNNTNTGRYCVALHLVAATNNGVMIPAQDVILTKVSGPGAGTSTAQPGDNLMQGTIVGFPCNASGLVCFGSAGVTRGKCAPGTCTTIAWTTSPNAAGCTSADQSPPGGQCRHQQICVQGFGVALACQANCTPSCGGVTTLRATANVAPITSGTPLTYVLTATSGVLKDASGMTVPSISSGATAALTYDFQVTVVGNTTYRVELFDSRINGGGCSRTASTSINVTPLAKPVLSKTGPDCAGNTVLTITNCVTSGVTYTWKDNGGVITDSDGNQCTFTGQFAVGNHSVTVTASTGAAECEATSDPVLFTVNPPIVTSLGFSGGAPCAQSTLQFTASAMGGTGSYTFAWKIDNVAVPNNNTNTLVYPPDLDCSPHTVSAQATDSAGCPSGNIATRTVTQTVTTQVS